MGNSVEFNVKFVTVLLVTIFFISLLKNFHCFVWCDSSISREKSDKEIMREIQAIMRQIASSITYLPCLDEPCKSQHNLHMLTPKWKGFFRCSSDLFIYCLGVFDVLAYTDKDVQVPFTWMESDPKLIANPQMVKLHSFDTKASSKHCCSISVFPLRKLFSIKGKGFCWLLINFFVGFMQIHKVNTLVSYKNDEWDEE